MFNEEKYWNEYVEYWKEKIRNTKEVPEQEWLLETIKLKGDLLEVGCGFGRLFPYYSKQKVNVYAMDISDKMIEEATKNIEPNVIEIKKGKAENIPYPNGYFDFVICLGVFDALEQEKALSEMLRVLKIDGRLLITGKNIHYFKDDYLALEAERKCKESKHPNSFTDVNKMIHQLKKKNHIIETAYYFLRRGDFSKQEFKIRTPQYFYEYFLCIKKKSYSINFKKFSEKNSKYVG